MRLVGLGVGLHPDAEAAYGAWPALSRVMPVGDLSHESLAAMFALRPLIAVQVEQELKVVGGFFAFRLLCGLDAIRHRPARANVLLVRDDAKAIASCNGHISI